ncbi:uncharacterized protein METZ01_LOCUS289295 [marine metagenome]|uniref:Uncharacterized protein n=1 Tax=marine metagenome TaxID=408172 RepID=A0A382LNI0_9ZZZZ
MKTRAMATDTITTYEINIAIFVR